MAESPLTIKVHAAHDASFDDACLAAIAVRDRLGTQVSLMFRGERYPISSRTTVEALLAERDRRAQAPRIHP